MSWGRLCGSFWSPWRGRGIVRSEREDLRIFQWRESLKSAGTVTVRIVNSILPGGRKATANRRTHRVNGAADTLSQLSGKRDAARTSLVGPPHCQTGMSEGFGKLDRHGSPWRIIGFPSVERDPEGGTAGATARARIGAFVVPGIGGISPLDDVSQNTALCLSQSGAFNRDVNNSNHHPHQRIELTICWPMNHSSPLPGPDTAFGLRSRLHSGRSPSPPRYPPVDAANSS